MRRRQVGDVRHLRNPTNGKVEPASRVTGIVTAEPLQGEWGGYEFEAWLEEDLQDTQERYISFP
jgi:hypothetical protein